MIRTHRASDLRIAFDNAFAQAPQTSDDLWQDFIAITLGRGTYAVALNELAGIYNSKKVTRIPSQASGLLGIAGFRGTILPVYDLAALIGLTPLERPRWLGVVAKAGIAVAFDAFEEHLRVKPADITSNNAAEAGRENFRHLLQTRRGIRTVIDLASVVRKITGMEI